MDARIERIRLKLGGIHGQGSFRKTADEMGVSYGYLRKVMCGKSTSKSLVIRLEEYIKIKEERHERHQSRPNIG